MGAEREGIWENEEGQWLIDWGNQIFFVICFMLPD